MLPQKSEDLFLFFRDPHLQTRICHIISRTGVAIDAVLAFIKAALECDPNGAFFGTAAYKLLFLIVEKIEQGPGDRLDYRRLAGAVLARDGGRAFGKIECR